MTILNTLERRSFRRILAATIGASLAIVGACTKSEDTSRLATAPQAVPPPSATAQPAAQTDAQKKPDLELTIGSDGDNIAFDKTALEAKAGQTVKLVFKNNSKTSNMPHNWVLVKMGTEAEVANAGIQAGDAAGWIAEGPSVIAHTAMIQAGQEGSVVFTVPAPGTYAFICTYPGHYATMKGVFTSKP